MTALTRDEPRAFGAQSIDISERLDVKAAAAKFYAGSVLQWDTSGGGVEKRGTGTTGFAGFAEEGADNSAGALGDKVVDVKRKGVVTLVLAATIALTNVGDTVYSVASDDNAFNLTAASNLPIGKIVRVVTAGGSGANEVEVYFAAEGYETL